MLLLGDGPRLNQPCSERTPSRQLGLPHAHSLVLRDRGFTFRQTEARAVRGSELYQQEMMRNRRLQWLGESTSYAARRSHSLGEAGRDVHPGGRLHVRT